MFMKKHYLTITTVLLLLGIIVFVGFCALFNPFDGKSDYSGYICSLETDINGALLIEAKMSDTDQNTMKLKTVENVKVYDLDGRIVNISDLKIGMLINVDFPLIKYRQKDGEYYLAKEICIIKW